MHNAHAARPWTLTGQTRFRYFALEDEESRKSMPDMNRRMLSRAMGVAAIAGLLCLPDVRVTVADQDPSRQTEGVRVSARVSEGKSCRIGIRLGENESGAKCVTAPTQDSEQRAIRLTVDDVKGTYTIPYIQSSRVLTAYFQFEEPRVAAACVSLMMGEHEIGMRPMSRPGSLARFADLKPGGYTIRVEGRDAEGRAVCHATYSGIGIGPVIAAIGDSITEGYYGRGFMCDDLDLESGRFPRDAVSRDGRNFPQYAPTTHDHLPSVNCFESWMTCLNDLLSEKWRCPVFIANEGWGGISSGGYLEMMTGNENWRGRMRALKPNLWLIHLGANDERAFIPAETFAGNMEAIVRLIIQQYGAKPANILIAKPNFDYFDGAQPILEGYCRKIEQLVEKKGLKPGADFFAGYASEKQKWYGDDPIHPTELGMKRMADLWFEAVARALPEGPES